VTVDDIWKFKTGVDMKFTYVHDTGRGYGERTEVWFGDDWLCNAYDGELAKKLREALEENLVEIARVREYEAGLDDEGDSLPAPDLTISHWADEKYND